MWNGYVLNTYIIVLFLVKRGEIDTRGGMILHYKGEEDYTFTKLDFRLFKRE